jgi:hypothetical protein
MLTAKNERLSIAGLDMALQRIGLSHWSAETVLRSWAIAPILVAGDRVAAPCFPDEAIWIGFWLEGDAESATVSVTDEITGRRACKQCPESFQLSALSDGSPRPIHRGPDEAMRAFAVEVAVTSRMGEGVRERFQLYLLEPQAWARESGRPPPPKLTGPPPLPPRLG